MRYVMQVALMMLLAILGSVGVVGIVLHLVPNDVFPARDAVALLQGLATVAAVALGALFAYRKLELFRDFEPHLTVTQAVASRAVGTQYVHISVIATLHNTSKVKVEIRRGFFRIHQYSPLVTRMLSISTTSRSTPARFSDIDWPVLDEIRRRLGPNELVVEPGASHHEPFEFIVAKGVATILVYSYFHNQSHSENPQSAQGWTATTFHDVALPESGNEGSYQEELHAIQ